jgi:hypothetical protein
VERKGTGASCFRLGNASVSREFYLSINSSSKRNKHNKFCDLVFFDLDPNDSIFVLIENKLFTKNHPNQLQQYWEMARKKYESKVNEFVYLTIDGSNPIIFKGDDEDTLRFWIRMSWTEDIKDILFAFVDEKSNQIIKDLLELLIWMNKIIRIVKETKTMENLRHAILLSSSECLIQELQRLCNKGT